MAAQALRQAPGVLAISVEYEKHQATVGSRPDQPVPKEAILESLKTIGYRGEFVE